MTAIESLEDRTERYKKAKTIQIQWRSFYQDAYRYLYPNRESFYTETEGVSKTNEIFDETPQIAGIQFANNLQSLLMPPYRRWIELEAGDVIKNTNPSDDQLKAINEKLENDTEILFRALESSNFNFAMNEGFQDIAVGTAVIALNEGPLTKPLNFMCIPLRDICFEEDMYGEISSFWHDVYISLKDIKIKWKNARLTESMAQQLVESPYEKVHLIEACVFYPENPIGQQFVYYVTDEGGENEIVAPEFREFNPFTCARYSKMSGETWGRGVAIASLSLIQVLNRMMEWVLRSAKFQAFPAYLMANTGAINAYNTTIEPGALIPYTPDPSGAPPLQPLVTSGNPEFAGMEIQQKQQTLRELFFADPLGQPGDNPNQTATEVSIRQQNFIRQNGAAIGRLAYEFIVPLITKCLMILRRKALIRDIQTTRGLLEVSIDKQTVALAYKSPLLDVQKQADIENITQYLQLMMQTLGANALMALEVFKLPAELAQLMDVPLDLVKSEGEIMNLFQQMQKNMEEAQQASQQQPALGEAGNPITQQLQGGAPVPGGNQ